MAIVFAVVTIAFFVVHLAQGTPCGGERPLPPDVCERERAVFGYDKPVQVQYVKYLAALLHGKLGYSFGLHRPVADALADAIPNTFTLALAALLIDFALGLALGIYQAVRAGRFGDVAVGNVALLVNSMPVFWLGLVLLLVFGQWLRWFPVGGPNNPVLCPHVDSPYCLLDFLWHLTLPAHETEGEGGEREVPEEVEQAVGRVDVGTQDGIDGSQSAGPTIPSCVPTSTRPTACSTSSGTSRSPPSPSVSWARRPRRATNGRRCSMSSARTTCGRPAPRACENAGCCWCTRYETLSSQSSPCSGWLSRSSSPERSSSRRCSPGPGWAGSP